MSGYLVDTNVLSEFNRRGDPDPLVKQWLEAAEPTSLYVSVLTLAEIRFGVERLPLSKRRRQLEEWLDGALPAWFADRMLQVGCASLGSASRTGGGQRTAAPCC
jgi:toxin FitB